MNALVKAEAAKSIAAIPEQRQYLTFMLGDEMFAVGILSIKEIIEYGQLTVVPMMPRFLRGVINLRGAVVPVVDLSARFGRGATQVTRRSCIVIVELEVEEGTQVVGMVVDAVNEVLEIATADIEPPPAFGARIRTDFISGMGKVNERFVILLDVDNVMSVEDLALIGQASAEAAVGCAA